MKRTLYIVFAHCVLVHAAGAENLCDRLVEVRTLPFKNEQVSDPAYTSIMEAGERAAPCLVANLVNTTLMPDPRKSPHKPGFAVGDLASMLLCELTGRSFDDQLPTELRKIFLERGVDVYFEYVADPKNRIVLQRDWEQWLAKKKKDQGR